jgi:hypothetical protein
MSEWRLAGRLETEGGEAASFIGYRVEALYGLLQRVATDTEREFSFAESSVADTQPATVAVPASTWSLCNAAGDFDLMLPPSDDIVSETLVFKVHSLSGEFIRDRKVGKSAVPETVVIKVPPPPAIAIDTAAPAPRSSYRIQGRIIERNGAALPPALRVVLSGAPEGANDDEPLQPVLVATADKSGYFYAVAPNVTFDRVVASVAGVPGDIGVQLIESRIPQRLPILIDLTTSDVKAKPGDCDCGSTSTPRAPSQEMIAELPEMFSSDLGTSGCIRFNVPNRAIEEFSFYSVVRTSEPAILGKIVGQPVADAPVTVPAQPPIPNTGGQSSTRATVALAALIERAIRTAIGLVRLSHKLPVGGSRFPVTWESLAALIRNAVIQSEGAALADDFFDQFEGWGVGKEAWTFEENSLGLVNNQARLDAVIKAAAAAGAGLEEPASEQRVAAFAISPAKSGYEVELASAARTKYLDIYKLRGLARPPGRVPLDGNSPVDWDSTPTFYEASSIAHGHVLHFKQVWYADGYSLGDLLYSLPLAPGQKKLVSVIDWERREQSTRDETTVATEGVGASLTRDRDLGEVVTGTLNEMSRGGSRNTTSGVGVGTGAAGNGSYQQFNFGALIGVSGGVGESVSSANQVSAKSLSASSLQTLRDRTLQSASAVRELRSTIVQTTRQGEAVRASTEVVANHNHCHALTIQYFEVLRHFAVVNELADVQECLFIPLPMTEFNRPKVLRWRQALSAYLQRPELAPAFDATRRVETQWSEDWSPAARYADELVGAIFGELTLTIQIPLPPLPEKPKPKPEDTAADTAAAVSKALAPTEGALGVILAIGTGGASLVAGAVTAAATDAAKAAAQGARAMAESLLNTESAEERYARFQQEVMPAAAAGFVDRLELYALVGDNEVKLNGADFTLVSDYRPGLPLLVSVRGRIRNGVSRASIEALVVKSSVPLPPGCRAIVNSARLNYQTQRFLHELLSDERVNDDIDLPVVAFTGANPFALNPGSGLPIIIPQPPLPPGFPSNWPPLPGMTPINGGAGAILYTPLDDWEQRYPRQEDYRLSKELIEHLNSNLEFYHHAIWWSMDPNRRYMLLDGYEAPNAGGRSVASAVENVVIGIVGNSLIMPVARGQHLDPQFKYLKGSSLLKHYAPQSPVPPSRVSLPTRGVFAEAVMGECNACEEIDDTKFWRWEESPIDEPPALDMQALASRRSEPAVGSPTQFPTPIVAIQNVPQAPDAAGVKSALDVLAQQSPFRDITGLAGTQANAAAAYAKAMDTALQFGKEASELAKQAAMTKNIGQTMRAIDKAESDSKIDQSDAKQLRTTALRTMAGDVATDPRAASVADRLKVIDDQQARGSITPEVAARQRDEVMSGLNPEEMRRVQESEAVTGILRSIPGGSVSSVEIGETKVRTAADTVTSSDAAERSFPWLWTEQTFVPAGSGWRRYGGIAVDEPLAVGQQGISMAERMQRALDIEGNRQFKDWIYNSATSRELEEIRLGQSTTPLPDVSLQNDAGAIWRRDLKTVKEWRELAQFIRQKVAARIAAVKSPGKVKAIINAAIREEIKEPTTPAGQAIHDAIKSTTGTDPKDIFRPETLDVARWAQRISVGALKSVLAGALTAAAGEYLAATERQQMANAYWNAVDVFISQLPEISGYAAAHPDSGTLLELAIEKTQRDQITETRLRWLQSFHGTSQDELLAWAPHRPMIALPEQPLTTIETTYIWLPPLNEQEEVGVTVVTPL